MIVGFCQPIEARQWGLRAVVDNGPYPFRFVHSRGWQLKGRGSEVEGRSEPSGGRSLVTAGSYMLVMDSEVDKD